MGYATSTIVTRSASAPADDGRAIDTTVIMAHVTRNKCGIATNELKKVRCFRPERMRLLQEQQA